MFVSGPGGFTGIHVVTAHSSFDSHSDITWRQGRIPWCPVIPSAAVMVPNWTGQAPASSHLLWPIFQNHGGGCYVGIFRMSNLLAFIGPFPSLKHGTVGNFTMLSWTCYYDGVCLILSVIPLVTFLPLQQKGRKDRGKDFGGNEDSRKVSFKNLFLSSNFTLQKVLLYYLQLMKIKPNWIYILKEKKAEMAGTCTSHQKRRKQTSYALQSNSSICKLWRSN